MFNDGTLATGAPTREQLGGIAAANDLVPWRTLSPEVLGDPSYQPMPRLEGSFPTPGDGLPSTTDAPTNAVADVGAPFGATEQWSLTDASAADAAPAVGSTKAAPMSELALLGRRQDGALWAAQIEAAFAGQLASAPAVVALGAAAAPDELMP
jgi:hypothetical protein